MPITGHPQNRLFAKVGFRGGSVNRCSRPFVAKDSRQL